MNLLKALLLMRSEHYEYFNLEAAQVPCTAITSARSILVTP